MCGVTLSLSQSVSQSQTFAFAVQPKKLRMMKRLWKHSYSQFTIKCDRARVL
uniref:Uncharacterized protein n=1 Tax=Anguilla anguilla TaxID=7936 RepID=A0A0E9RKC6_ANGAN